MSLKLWGIAVLVAGLSVGCSPESKKVEAAKAQLNQVKKEAEVQEAAQAKLSSAKIEAANTQLDQAKKEADSQEAAQAKLSSAKIGVASAHLDQVRVEAREAEERALEAYAYAQKADYVAKKKKELAEMEVELSQLSHSRASQDAQARLAVFREKWNRANEKLAAAESTTESNWEAFKAGVKQASHEVKENFQDTRMWLSDQIKP